MKILKNKKAKYFITMVSLFLIIALITFVYVTNKNKSISDKHGYIGKKANLLTQAYQDGESTWFYIDMAAKHSAPQAYFMTAFDGAMASCGDYYNFKLWDFDDPKCLPMNGNSPTENLQGGFERELNQMMDGYFSLSQDIKIPETDYDTNILEQKDGILVTGDLRKPLTFEMKKDAQTSYTPLPNIAGTEEFTNNPRINYLRANNPYVTQEFLNKVVEVANDVKADPVQLMMVMNFETGGRFSPSVKNPTSTATGLIQFLEKTANGLGTTTAQLRTMTAVEQLDKYVREYLKRQAKAAGIDKYNTLAQLYLAVLYPASLKDAATPDAIVFQPGTAAYAVNCGFVHCKGPVTVAAVEAGPRRSWEKIPTLSSSSPAPAVTSTPSAAPVQSTPAEIPQEEGDAPEGEGYGEEVVPQQTPAAPAAPAKPKP